MQNKFFRIVFIGDIVGRYGRRFLGKALPLIKIKFSPGLVIANGENSAGGLGITRKTAFEMFEAGVDVITGGNHIWDKKEAIELLKDEERILRPINYPPEAPGNGCYVFGTENQPNTEVMIINLQGRVFMEPVVDNPFLAIDDFLQHTRQKIIFMDFHAEATAEKMAMGFYLDGRVSAVLGTHTHIQTTDLRILKNGTAYQTDVGMTGAFDSIIGMRIEPVIRRFVTGVNQKFEVSKENVILDMSIVDIDTTTGKAVGAQSLRIFESTFEQQLLL
ncbi:MAG: TIGR00282 family metallophosphoesterase [Candidatus Aminicenantes bacterium]|nr:TIGR00282 family metallophosphoesterase [Candidatus Aminicenantes bacterium]NIM77766.1 TIGR00282 family metallophosphoesterase [Candidatus Aminicenantes bacterium]NIN17079.1 TIGR00282 family metallophosphoesterase [Candidatus Aminicenantes bacterium]NIN40972.1 TIGR00282 family metallophosphoesterase [Candidatus Aminicenantes bacterium]NIN83777.1 TIGR00282 family metallophosphoesterase [Candidatus Aminicenantes bacterium]